MRYNALAKLGGACYNKANSLMNDFKKKILIVDDSELNRAMLADMLSDRFETIEAENGMEAMAILNEHEMEIALMLLDIVMPVMDGFEVLAMMNKRGWIDSIPVIMISSETAGTYIDHAYKLGAIDYISRPFDERTVKHRVTSNYMLSLKQQEIHQLLSDKIYEKEKDNRLMIEILSHIVEFRNGESGMHVLHVHVITEMLLSRLIEKTDKYGLTEEDVRTIATASALHDIGKIVIPSDILNKPARFTPEEFAVMQMHTTEGERILNNVPAQPDEPLIRVSREICRWHHERFDGGGYPDGLKGDDIPISAQVVSLADVYDALTSRRVYKEAYPPDVAIRMIRDGECGAFNPLLLECLEDIADKLGSELTVISYGNVTESSINDTVNKMIKNTGTDVSRRMVKQIEHERMKYKYLADITHEITFEYVASPEMIKMSDWSAESLGVPVTIIDPLDDEKWCSIFDKNDFARLVESIKATTPENPVVTEKLLLNTDGTPKWNKVVAKAMWSDGATREFEGAVCQVMDDNDSTMTIKKLQHAARRDPMTGLYNHAAARDRIQKLLNCGEGKHYLLALMDIDNFKRANDSRGHLFGDSIIEVVAARIKDNIRSADIAARVGGDEFIVFMEYRGKAEPQIKRVFNKLCGEYDGFDITMSMGIALSDDDGNDFDAVFKKADAAMYAVKKNKKHGYKFYDASMDSILGSK